MISCCIIDDELPAREFMQSLIVQHFADKLKVQSTAGSAKEGAAIIKKYRPDIVFLDLEMPGENGFKLYDYLESVEFETIFTTAYPDYALDAIKFAALDYLLKPIGITELGEALQRYEKKMHALRKPAERIASLLNQLSAQKDTHGKITIPTTSGFQLERIANILYCESEQDRTRIYTLAGTTIISSKPLAYFEELLPKTLFFRIHKSSMVNMNHVKRYSRQDGFKVILENGAELEVASRRNSEFVKLLTNRN